MYCYFGISTVSYVLMFFTEENEEFPLPASVGKVDVYIPSEGTLYDYIYQFKQRGTWKFWPDLLKEIKTQETINIEQTVVPTIESVR